MITALLALALAAPAPLRLADLLREAREKNPDLKAATARVRAAQSSISPAGALDDPMLMVQLWNAPVDFSTVPLMVQLSQNLPLGGKRGARTDVARADAAMADADLLQKQRDVETQVASAYFDLFLADRTQEIDDELQAILNVVLRASEARVSTGKAEQVELLRARDRGRPWSVRLGAAERDARPRSDCSPWYHHAATGPRRAAGRRRAERARAPRGPVAAWW